MMQSKTTLALLPIALLVIADIADAQRRATRSAPRSTSGAPTRSAPVRSAPVRSAPVRSAPVRSAPRVQSPRRSTPTRSTPTRTRSYTPTRRAPVRSTPTRTRTYNPTPRTPVRNTPTYRPPTRSTPTRTRTYNPTPRTPATTPTRNRYTPPTRSSTPRRVGSTNLSPRTTYQAPTRRTPTSTNSNRYTSPNTPVRVRYNTRPRTTANPNTSLRDMYRRVPSTRTDSGTNFRSNRVRNNISTRSSNRYDTDVRRNSGGVRRSNVNRYTPKRAVRPESRSPRRNPGGNRGSGNRNRPRINTRNNRTVSRPRRAVRKHASHHYRYGGRRYGRHHHHHHLFGHLLGLSWCYHLGWRNWYHYAYDPYYCNYYVGHGYHHYHWRYHYCHPLNYVDWWYPSTYYPTSYIYINSRGDYSPYPSTVVIADDTPVEEPEAAPVKAGKPSTETLIKRHVTLGDFYFKEGRYSEASESYLRALAYAPEDATIHFVLADALFALGDYHYAAFIIQKALRLDPAMAFAEADKRKFYAEAKEFEKHMATILSYVKEKPFDVAGHLVLGYNYKFSDQKEKAIATFKKVLEISPENEAAKLFLEALTEPPVKKAGEDPAGGTDEKAEKPAEKAVEKPIKKDR